MEKALAAPTHFSTGLDEKRTRTLHRKTVVNRSLKNPFKVLHVATLIAIFALFSKGFLSFVGATQVFSEWSKLSAASAEISALSVPAFVLGTFLLKTLKHVRTLSAYRSFLVVFIVKMSTILISSMASVGSDLLIVSFRKSSAVAALYVILFAADLFCISHPRCWRRAASTVAPDTVEVAVGVSPENNFF